MFKIVLQIIFFLILLSFFGIIVYEYFDTVDISNIENKYFDLLFSYLYIIGDYTINIIIPKAEGYLLEFIVWLNIN